MLYPESVQTELRARQQNAQKVRWPTLAHCAADALCQTRKSSSYSITSSATVSSLVGKGQAEGLGGPEVKANHRTCLFSQGVGYARSANVIDRFIDRYLNEAYLTYIDQAA